MEHRPVRPARAGRTRLAASVLRRGALDHGRPADADDVPPERHLHRRAGRPFRPAGDHRVRRRRGDAPGGGRDGLPQATLVVFDDAPFELRRDARDDGSDESPLAAFGRQLEERARQLPEKTLLLLADRRVSGGDLMKIATVARASGVERILFAERKLREGAK